MSANPVKNETAAIYAEKIKEYFDKEGYTPKAFVHSFGCQQNVSDGEKLMGVLAEAGYTFTDSPDNADLVLYNTCAVRETAEMRVFGAIGELKHVKAKNPSMIIALCGCMAQQEQVSEKVKKSYPYVDIVFGTFAVHMLLEYVYRVISERKRIFDISEHNNSVIEDLSQIRTSKFKAYVPIMYGCNNFCSYCIVPYVRGRERSRSADSILSEVRQLAGAGYKEITLLGQNVNSYGKTLPEGEKISFAELLRRVNSVEGDFIIRFMSPHPKDFTDELIEAIFECEKVERHIHLPLQSGSDRILAEMNRRYTAEQYMDIVRKVRNHDPEFSISTDIIVGFPNESEEDFAATLDIMRRVKYDNIFSFIYSKRSGTRAAEIDDKVSDKEKSERMGRLLSLQREISTENYKRFVGRTLNVLIDEKSKKDGFVTGKSDEFIIVEMKGNVDLIGQKRKVYITEAHNWALVGDIEN